MPGQGVIGKQRNEKKNYIEILCLCARFLRSGGLERNALCHAENSSSSFSHISFESTAQNAYHNCLDLNEVDVAMTSENLNPHKTETSYDTTERTDERACHFQKGELLCFMYYV